MYNKTQKKASSSIKPQQTALFSQGVFLQQYLRLFSRYLENPDIIEICVNRPHEVWVEYKNSSYMSAIEDANITQETLLRLGRLIASKNYQSLSLETPLLSATLPKGERIQIILPPAARKGLALAIRKKSAVNLTLKNYEEQNFFNPSCIHKANGHAYHSKKRGQKENLNNILENYLEKNDYRSFFSYAVQNKANILISGGTSSGKTTFLNALLKEIPCSERIITLEDAAELTPTQANHVSLIAAKEQGSLCNTSIQELLEASLRLRPDRIFLGELRGSEAFSFLRAINSGHPGSITSVHADTTQGALSQICLMVLQAGRNLEYKEIKTYICSIIDVVVQINKIGNKRQISDILLLKET